MSEEKEGNAVSAEELWQAWREDDRLEAALRSELEALIAAKRLDDLRDRFVQDLAFGTGGMRARLGAGINRMNVHTVRRATWAVAMWLADKHPDKRKLVIGYDGRHQSREFAEAAAQVAAASGVEAVIYRWPRPTPYLSFAVRHLGCGAGVMITASHNPPEYNGYKVYGADGGQILNDDAQAIERLMHGQADVFAVPYLSPQSPEFAKLVAETDAALEEAYLREIVPLHGLASDAEKAGLRIVYTPLHGTGAETVPEALRRAGFANVITVPEQMTLDPDFSDTKSPNPEEEVAYERALEVAREVSADIILATDPDTDRVGVMARGANGAYQLLSGNDVGGLALDFYLGALRGSGQLPADGRVVTTIVTSDFGAMVAASYGVATERTLTGFKYIGDKIGEYERQGTGSFVFGYEESVGYLALPIVRDKDAVQAAVLMASMAANCKRRYGDLLAGRGALFEKFGHFRDKLFGYTFTGVSGIEQMQNFLNELRERPPVAAGVDLVASEDYVSRQRVEAATGRVTALTLPEADVIKLFYQGGSWMAVRPSGTEPKLKVYLGAKGDRAEEAERALTALEAAFAERIRPFLEREST